MKVCQSAHTSWQTSTPDWYRLGLHVGLAMREDIQYGQLIGSIYEGLGVPSEWPGVLARIRRYVGSEASQLQVFDSRSFEARFGLVDNLDESSRQIYNEHYLAKDPRIPAALANPGRTLTCPELINPAEFDRSALVNELLDPLGLRWCQVSVFRIDATTAAFLGSMRPRCIGAFARADAQRQDLIVPHLARAVSLQQNIAALEEQISGYRGMADSLAAAFMLVTSSARILVANAAAEALLAARDGVGATMQRIVGATLQDTKRLHAAIRAVADSRDGGAPGPSAVRMGRPSGGPDYVAVLLPLPRATPLRRHAPAADVVVMITDPAAATPAPESLLAGLGIPPAEARLALALAAGERLDAYAERAGVTMNTVRTQLASLFRRTGTSRQAELVRFVTSIVGTRLKVPLAS